MLAACVLFVAAGLSLEAARGRQVFEHGQTADGVSIEGLVGADVTVPGLACATCHGNNGRGRPEGAVRPTDVRWSSLSRAASSASSRARPAYDDAALTRAIALGRAPGGARLDRVMPRYRLTATEMRAVIAYLHVLGERPEPGVRDDAVTIGVLAPDGAAGPALRAALDAWAAELNARGGVFARRIELRALPASAQELAALSEDEQPFAFISGPLLDPTDSVEAWMRAARVPCLRLSGPASSRAPDSTQRVAPTPGSRVEHWRALALGRRLEEALVRAGRSLDREGLLRALGSLRAFDTGFGPP